MAMQLAMMEAMIPYVNVAEFKNCPGEYLAIGANGKGKEIIVCKRNLPVARFKRLPTKPKDVNQSKLGSMKGTGCPPTAHGPDSRPNFGGVPYP